MVQRRNSNTPVGILLPVKRVRVTVNVYILILIPTLLKSAQVGLLIHLVDNYVKEKYVVVELAI